MQYSSNKNIKIKVKLAVVRRLNKSLSFLHKLISLAVCYLTPEHQI